MNEESSFLQPFHQRAFALFFFLFTASISCFILHFVVSNTIYSSPHCRSSWSTEQPQIKGRGKIAFVIRMAVGLQPAEIIICLEEKQQWEGVSGGCVCVIWGCRVCGTLRGIFSSSVVEVLLVWREQRSNICSHPLCELPNAFWEYRNTRGRVFQAV